MRGGGATTSLLARHAVTAGDVLLLAAGTLHAVGPGVLLYEIQQPSDITYRVDDWGRPASRDATAPHEAGARVRRPPEPARCRATRPAAGASPPAGTSRSTSWTRPRALDPAGRTVQVVTAVGAPAELAGAGWAARLEPLETIVVPAAAGALGAAPGPRRPCPGRPPCRRSRASVRRCVAAAARPSPARAGAIRRARLSFGRTEGILATARDRNRRLAAPAGPSCRAPSDPVGAAPLSSDACCAPARRPPALLAVPPRGVLLPAGRRPAHRHRGIPRGVLAEGSTLPQISRLRALAAATLAALVIVTIQPPAARRRGDAAPCAARQSRRPPSWHPAARHRPRRRSRLRPSRHPPRSDRAAAAPAAAADDPRPGARHYPPRASAPGSSPADRVIAIAMAERGRPWVYGATGPRRLRLLRPRGLRLPPRGRPRRRSGAAATAAAGRCSAGREPSTSPGRPATAATSWSGATAPTSGSTSGTGRAISTLTSGVRVHGLRVLTARFTTFISTGLSGPPLRATATARRSRRDRHGAPAPDDLRSRAKVVARRTVTVSRLNLRSAPRVTAAVSRVLVRGTRLGVVRSAKDGAGRTWYRVIVGTRIGWVAGWLTRPAS